MSDQPPAPDPHSRFFNRELSWVAFNERVLEEGLDPSRPLFERLKFLCIFSGNLDNFFMVRVAALKHQVRASVAELSLDGLSPFEQLRQIHDRISALVTRQRECIQAEILPGLARHGILIHRYEQLPPDAQQTLHRYFESDVFPVLTPLAVDPGHPFPHLLNLGLNLGLVLEAREGTFAPLERTGIAPPDEGLELTDPRGSTPPAAAPGPTSRPGLADVAAEPVFAVLQVPSVLPRLVLLKGMPSGLHYVLLEEVMARYAADLFPGFKVKASFPFRVTRDADVTIAETEAEDLMQSVEQSIRNRDRGAAVRLEVQHDAPPELVDSLGVDLGLHRNDIYRTASPLNLPDFLKLSDLDYPALKDPPFTPRPLVRNKGESFFARVRAGDVLLHHPYDSFDPVLELVTTAAEDRRVLAIKQTLYRTSGGDSPIVRALARAAENGKQVTALVELKARFDEKANIRWARALEDAGVHVVYGLIGLKTHAKLTLVVRKDDDGIRRYIHMGTGNYNSRTARIYTDLGLITCRREIGEDASQLFNLLTGYSCHQTWRRLIVAPHGMRERLVGFIERETAHARAGRPARIVTKLNSLGDSRVINALYEASQAGVQIDLIVRGICCLRPGLPGLSENVRVVSIVGRLLEHERIAYFWNGGAEEVWLLSGDWMERNFDGRVEIAFPVEDAALRDLVITRLLRIALADNVQARDLASDGTYRRRTPSGRPSVNAQELLMLEALPPLEGVPPSVRPAGLTPPAPAIPPPTAVKPSTAVQRPTRSGKRMPGYRVPHADRSTD